MVLLLVFIYMGSPHSNDINLHIIATHSADSSYIFMTWPVATHSDDTDSFTLYDIATHTVLIT